MRGGRGPRGAPAGVRQSRVPSGESRAAPGDARSTRGVPDVRAGDRWDARDGAAGRRGGDDAARGCGWRERYAGDVLGGGAGGCVRARRVTRGGARRVRVFRERRVRDPGCGPRCPGHGAQRRSRSF